MFCNRHIQDSMERYGLMEIGYCRLIARGDELVYFERPLCSLEEPLLFKPRDFFWRWSTPKRTVAKQQLPALHGFLRGTNRRWWAWHGLGENQLHFTGEREWWPAEENNGFIMKIPREEDRISFRELLRLLDS